MILDVEFEEMNSEFEADFGEVYRITDADIIEANKALDECVHGYVTGASYAENVGEAVAAIEDVGAAIAQKGVELSDTPDGYADLIRNELIQSGVQFSRELWDSLFYESRTNYSNIFNQWNCEELKPYKKMFFKGSALANVFSANKSLKRVSKEYFDFSLTTPTTNIGTSNSYMFQDCHNLEVVEDLGFQAGECKRMYANCYKLHTIERMPVTTPCTYEGTFVLCNSLKNITFDGKICQNIGISYSPLSMESVRNIVTHLTDYSGTDKEFKNTIKFKSGIWDEFNATECTEGYPTWYDYVQAKGWNV